jgi:uncharacterized protein (DUF849 family)
MNAPCIITVAITGSVPGKKDNPAVPIAVQEQIDSTHEAFEAGATLVHLHKPEIQAFDLSMIFQAVAMQKTGKIRGPLHIQFVMGVKNAMPVDREVFEFYVKTLKRLAPDATWTGAGIGKDQATASRWSAL